jgi:ATP synthase I chain
MTNNKGQSLDNLLSALIKSAALRPPDEGDRQGPDASPPMNQGEPDSFTAPAAVERRVWRNIFVVLAVAILTSAVVANLKFVFGLALGGMLALLNYRWLHSSLRAALASGEKKAPPGTTMKFVFRWLVIATVVYVASLTGYVEAIAMLIGLFAPALAIMMEAAYVTYRTLTQHGER